MAEHYDAIVVGAGPAGNAAALTLARAGSRVLQLERAEYPGARNTGGAVLCAAALDELIHDFRASAPLERQIVEQRVWTLDLRSHVASHFQTDDGSDVRAQRYTVLRAPFDAWLSSAVEQAGVRVLYATTVTGLVHEADGRVIGVRTDRGGNEVFADVVVLGDGVEALVARNAGIREDLQPLQVALTVKELRCLPRAVIDERFGISGDDGVILEAAGSLVDGHLGFGFIHTHRESLSVGIGCLMSDVVDNDVTPSELLARFKRHPSIRPLLEGSEVASFAAQTLPRRRSSDTAKTVRRRLGDLRRCHANERRHASRGGDDGADLGSPRRRDDYRAQPARPADDGPAPVPLPRQARTQPGASRSAASAQIDPGGRGSEGQSASAGRSQRQIVGGSSRPGRPERADEPFSRVGR